ncbi:hypothetical protein C2E23DRAFT_860621 [Lenzites betulinus]|nr:hypothetical protein C2E23DRAFT_860621 [Lenzites betulinus]
MAAVFLGCEQEARSRGEGPFSGASYRRNVRRQVARYLGRGAGASARIALTHPGSAFFCPSRRTGREPSDPQVPADTPAFCRRVRRRGLAGAEDAEVKLTAGDSHLAEILLRAMRGENRPDSLNPRPPPYRQQTRRAKSPDCARTPARGRRAWVSLVTIAAAPSQHAAPQETPGCSARTEAYRAHEQGGVRRHMFALRLWTHRARRDGICSDPLAKLTTSTVSVSVSASAASTIPAHRAQRAVSGVCDGPAGHHVEMRRARTPDHGWIDGRGAFVQERSRIHAGGVAESELEAAELGGMNGVDVHLAAPHNVQRMSLNSRLPSVWTSLILRPRMLRDGCSRSYWAFGHPKTIQGEPVLCRCIAWTASLCERKWTLSKARWRSACGGGASKWQATRGDRQSGIVERVDRALRGGRVRRLPEAEISQNTEEEAEMREETEEGSVTWQRLQVGFPAFY